ncbi:DUF1642 domain-containing protein [Streptococcus suis]|uniref:DUF1642 domain-containing protein n=2 Tax=Streptococcus suis TaxID=1307 RepID=UPI0009452253|nr:DUF1642 domain-containing protein [Streptococcus suis]MCB2883652.1 DUF1642 domain-containing protein [Streptococcus suis]MCB2910415.1 DUF1642 domain-containing protein [Streptococcus suis]MCB2912490.1 DUF1642 domain-containing protein [Streptococcus suis]MDS1159971.1 DUF1642 domain-containing protein [Streptococcus suis]WNF60387.1 DUF1642 domain-containing protein [Streptococcus suis]
MNKQEAIETIKNIDTLNINDIIAGQSVDMVIKNQVLDIISQINEPRKVVVPKHIADKIEYCKDTEGYDLFHAMDYCYQYKDSADWLECNEETFARAWYYGYEIEQERLYVVTDGNKLYLKEFDELNAIIIIDDVVGAVDYAKRYEDKTKAQQAADELGWIVKEVE